eukprot:CAMPEP_0167765494 /NCGR_PEP_ID=MMETSP0110_2-20121227/14725_1 /TAXON_ID=629695 /ORGANISM="Gymnochlora sp., Strain CCMP2014" /LENGTH=86 /DNA_ID=CAMNT_0007653227 /DNA_START=254 /DNA_END=514 /DNA_ORIENTATION=-
MAAEYGKADIAAFLCERKADLEVKDCEEKTPLGVAKFERNEDVFKVIQEFKKEEKLKRKEKLLECLRKSGAANISMLHGEIVKAIM